MEIIKGVDKVRETFDGDFSSYILNHSSECKDPETCFLNTQKDHCPSHNNFTMIDGRDAYVYLTDCRLSAEDRYRYWLPPSFRTLAEGIGEDLDFKVVSEKGRGFGPVAENIARDFDRPLLFFDQVINAGIRPLIQTRMSIYWREDEIRQLYLLQPKIQKEAVALFHEKIERSKIGLLKDAYLFKYPFPKPGYPFGVFKQGLSIYVDRRLIEVAYGSNMGKDLKKSALVPRGHFPLETEFKRVFSELRIPTEVARALGLMCPTEWYDGRGIKDALSWLSARSAESSAIN